MSGNSLKWIPLGGMELSAANLAPAEKLRKFGFSLVCCEFGSQKLTKAELCIYDILAEKENPNILLITSARVLYGWYRLLMTGIGADFKVISGAANEIVFFSQDGSNLCLMPADALKGANGLKGKVPEGFKWDLIVIDDEQDVSVPDYRAWKELIPWKAERLLMFTCFPAKNDEDRAGFSGLVKSVLDDEELSAAADGIALDSSALPLSFDTPVMMAGSKSIYSGEVSRDVSFVDYEYDKDFISGLRRRMDIRSGLPNYKYGGNIFEEFDIEELKGTYTKPSYTASDVSELRAADNKLDVFLKLADEIISDENSRAIVYCCDRGTAEFLRRTLAAVCTSGPVKMARGELFSNENILRKLRVDDKTTYPKFIIAGDDIGAVGDGLDRVTHVINYELPSSPVLFERRMTRHGAANENSRKFIIFRDGNGLFDSRMLDKVLFGSLPGALRFTVPQRNILLDIGIKAECVSNLIADLKYVHSYSSEVDSCYDLVKRFKGEYELLGAGKVSNAKQLSECSGELLDRICRFYGVSRDSSKEDIEAALAPAKGLCTSVEGVLTPVGSDIISRTAESLDADPASQPYGAEVLAGIKEARQHIDELHSGRNYHLMIKNDIQSMNDCIQYPVLFGIWRYRVREEDSVRSFRDFIKIYNDGL